MIFSRKLLWTQQTILSPENLEGKERTGLREMDYIEELTVRYPALEQIKESIKEAYEILRESYETGHKLLVAGNGGSAGDSEHIAGELMKGFKKQRALPEKMAARLKEADSQMGEKLAQKLQGSLKTIALTGHIGLSTAFLNDVDGQLVYAQQVYGYGEEGDVFLAISTSGNSANIHYACVTARAKGLKVIGLTGKDGGALKQICDVAMVVPETETYKIQELHLPIYHTLCLMLEDYFFDS